MRLISLKLPLLMIGAVWVMIILFPSFNFPISIFYTFLSTNGKATENLINDGLIEPVVSVNQAVSRTSFILKIPNINVDADIESVGLTLEGAVDVPKSFANVAWFNLGPRPGKKGSSVVSGHSGWKNGKQSVFDNLYKIKKGDKIYIEDGEGIINVFVVRKFKTYGSNDDASDIFSSSDGKAHLNLITCVGNWYVGQKSPNDRFVVFADKE